LLCDCPPPDCLWLAAQTLGNLLQVLLNPAPELVAARGLACVLLRQVLEAAGSGTGPGLEPTVIDYGKRHIIDWDM
jgi:hypothetical protein